MGKVLMAGIVPSLVAPVNGVLTSDLPEGQIVMINENGVPIPFYLAKHNYESGLNGTGRMLLVRKECYDTRPWNSANNNIYASSTLNNWLNDDYKALLDTTIQNLIGTTTFYYNPGNNSTSVATLSRSVFTLSIAELGLTHSNAVVDGSKVPIADILKIARLNGSPANQWTRTTRTDYDAGAFYVNTSGATTWQYFCSDNSYGSRPCFTLPSDILASVNDDGTVSLML